MPTVDPSGILRRPTLGGSSFDVIRRQESTSTKGRVSTEDLVFEGVVGVVTPVGPNSLTREEAYQTQANSIQVVTDFMLRGPSKGKNAVAGGRADFQPDIIKWAGDHYIVKVLDDFSAFGGGMVRAECVSYDYIEKAPVNRKIQPNEQR